jgi:hypothetical protein
MNENKLTPSVFSPPFNPFALPGKHLPKAAVLGSSVLIVSTFATPIPPAIAAISTLALSVILNLVSDIVVSSKQLSLKTKKIFLKIKKIISIASLFLIPLITFMIAGPILGLSFSTISLSLLAYVGISIAMSLVLSIGIFIFHALIQLTCGYFIKNNSPFSKKHKNAKNIVNFLKLFRYSSQDLFNMHFKRKKKLPQIPQASFIPNK